jgi:hypothetical protein
MSDQLQILVIDVNDSLQNDTAKRICQYLLENAIISNEKADNVYGGDGFGFVPGSNIEKFSDEDPDDYGLNDLITNGVAIIEERRAYHDYSDIIAFKCPACSAETQMEAGEDLKLFWNKVHAYGNGTMASINCPSCNSEHAINQYDYMGQLAFGNVGIEFYNWPPISNSCKEEIEKTINSKVNVVFSHL